MVNLWELYEATESGCDKKCNDCPLWLKHKNVCMHEDNKRWQEWAKKQHEEFGEMLRMYEG